MVDSLKTKEVLAMYDVRGIQNYIFHTNRIKEIIGASSIVDNIITDALDYIIEEQHLEKEKYLTDWTNDDCRAFLNDASIKMQVMFIGGGNAYVLFREGAVCELFNRKLAKYLLEYTYSLQLAVAVIEKTDNYKNDYEVINEKMGEIKSKMPSAKPLGAFPFMQVDSVTGAPAAGINRFDNKYVCKESLLKLDNYKEDKDAYENLLDNMVTQKGDSSFLAVVHIDGNNMGKRIKSIMQNQIKYDEAVCTMREISKNLKDAFLDAYQEMDSYIEKRKAEIKPGYQGKLCRKLILAGDDITFICNAMVAMDAVKVFLKNVSEKAMYYDKSKTEDENLQKYGLSACAGIAYMNSHFPFSDAYEVAEACCTSAKSRAKEMERRASVKEKGEKNEKEEGMIGNFFDFQICNHVKTLELDRHREKNYKVAGSEKSMIFRPYYVSSVRYDSLNDLNKKNMNFDYENILVKNLLCFNKISNSRSKMKALRNAFSLGWEEVEKEIVFLKSRGVDLPSDTDKETWYDALEMMDLYVPDRGEVE